MTLTLDQQFFTVMTIRVVARMAGHIADTDVMQALLHSQFKKAIGEKAVHLKWVGFRQVDNYRFINFFGF